MKKQLLFLLITFLSLGAHAQISFEKGYFIDNLGQRTDALIKNVDWKNNPTKFVYKRSEASDQEVQTIHTIKEFGILDVSKYIRAEVNLDRSSEVIGQMTKAANAIFTKEQLFLKVLVEGKANLFFYEDGNLKRFFYSIDSSDIKPLVFKSYETLDGKIKKNLRFRNQLWTDLKCPDITIKDIESIEYKKRALIGFFIKYNACGHAPKSTLFEKKRNKNSFHLSIKTGINRTSLSLENRNDQDKKTDFGNKMTFRLGVETAFALPFNNNKWYIIVEPSYHQYQSKIEKPLLSSPLSTLNEFVEIKYKSLDIPIGLRYNFFLSDHAIIFMNGLYVLNLTNSNSVIDFKYGTDLSINNSANVALGMGFKYRNKYSIEGRYQTNREILNQYIHWNSDYKTFSIVFGYTIF